jgi:hypothetical protein
MHNFLYCVGYGPPRIPDGHLFGPDPAPLFGRHCESGTQTPGRKLLMRVWISLPKKAALYTMNFPPNNVLAGKVPNPLLRTPQGLIKTPEEQEKCALPAG